MKNLLSQKRMLGIALLEDTLFLFFFALLLISGLEILLPGSVSTKLPIAFFFPFLGFLFLLYIILLKKEKVEIRSTHLPRSIFFIGLIVWVIITLFMNRGFGISGALLQVFLFLGILFLSSRLLR